MDTNRCESVDKQFVKARLDEMLNSLLFEKQLQIVITEAAIKGYTIDVEQARQLHGRVMIKLAKRYSETLDRELASIGKIS